MELAMLERCDHPNVIKLLDAYQVVDDPHVINLVIEPYAPYTLNSFLHGSDGQRRIDCPWFKQNSPLTERRIYKILDGLASGLEYLHSKSIKHKDIKPDNILLYNEGHGAVRPVIADLGSSKIFVVEGSTDYDRSTYAFLAPEQVSRTESTPKADIWQLGCCFALTLAVFRRGSAGCSELWRSFEYTDVDCSCNIALQAEDFMKCFDYICGQGSPSQRYAHWLVTAMLELLPKARFDIGAVREKVSYLVSMV
jgi:serine/threonine protein kinase